MTETLLSNSELQSFKTCTRKWFYNYKVNLVPVEPSRALGFGSNVHDILEAQCLEGWDVNTLPDTPEGRLCREFLYNFHPQEWKDPVPEKEIAISIDGAPVFRGLVDVFRESEKLITDYKTGGRKGKWNEAEVARSPQFKLYSLGIYQEYGFIPECVVHYGRSVDPDNPRSKAPFWEEFRYQFDSKELAQFEKDATVDLARIASFKVEALDTRIDTPTIGPHCSWCSYSEACDARSAGQPEQEVNLLNMTHKKADPNERYTR